MCNEVTRREVTDVMFYFREFFVRNPSEIAILFFNIRNDVGENVHLPNLWLEMMQVMGLVEMVYVHDAPNSKTPWPTLREMIDMNKVHKFRIVFSIRQFCFLPVHLANNHQLVLQFLEINNISAQWSKLYRNALRMSKSISRL